MSTIYASYNSNNNDWSQYAPASVGITSDAKNDKVFNVKNYSGEYSIFAWVSDATDTRVYIKKVDRNGTITELDDSGNAYITISSGSGRDIFLCFDRSQTNIYVGVYGEDSIWKFTSADMADATHITGAITGDLKAMKMDKNALLTTLGGTNVINQFDNADSDNQVTTDEAITGLVTNEIAPIYFDSSNNLMVLHFENDQYYINTYDQATWTEQTSDVLTYSYNITSTLTYAGADLLKDVYGDMIALISTENDEDYDTASRAELSNPVLHNEGTVDYETTGFYTTSGSYGNIYTTIVDAGADNTINIYRYNGVTSILIMTGTDTAKAGGTITMNESNSSGWSGTIDISAGASASATVNNTVNIYPKFFSSLYKVSTTTDQLYLYRFYGATNTNIAEYMCNLNTNYQGDYIYSRTSTDGNTKKILRYQSDSGTTSFLEDNVIPIANNFSNNVFRCDITGYDISASGCAGA